MKEEIRLSFYLDNRRKKAEALYPVKLRIYQPRTTKEKLFRIGLDFTEEEFKQGYLKQKPELAKDQIKGKAKKELEEKLDQLTATYTKAKELLQDLKEFNFEEFEKRFYNKAAKVGAFFYFEETIQKMKFEGRVRTAESYQLALKNLKQFANLKRKKPLADLPFENITTKFLNQYESWLATEKNHSKSTIGIYIRPLRAVFNTAIADKNSGVKFDIYPFGGKNGYQPPTGQNIKKALSASQLKTLFELQPQNQYQQKAKDFWFFSYLANGMNFKDIAELKFENLHGHRLAFYRSKTKNKTKAAPVLIQALLPEKALEILNTYSKPQGKKEDFIFDILSPEDNPEKAVIKVKAFTRFVNQHIKKLAETHNQKVKAEAEKQNKKAAEADLLPEEISTYWARHSFTTQAIRKGASMELLQESLGHKNLATTQNYWAGFATDVKENLAKSLLEF